MILRTLVKRKLITMRTLVLLAFSIFLGHVSCLDAAVKLQQQEDQIVVTVDGKPLGIYTTSDEFHRPYFWEIRAADGTLLTRPISPPGGDHPHHTGVWHTVDKVNDIDFWHLEGRIENTSVELIETEGNPAIMRVNNRWLDREDRLVLREQTMIRIYDNRMLFYDIKLTAGDKEVSFGDTEEGFFAFRMADSMREEETGQVINADGLKTAKGCWGKRSNWVDYFGEVDGKVFGAAIFDHPGNFRRGRYHVRDYGLFTISPFGEGDYTEGLLPAQPAVIATGATLHLRYGIYFHDGNTEQAKIPAAYENFVAQPDLSNTEHLRLREIKYRSTADDSIQPAMFYSPLSDKKVPLLVTLHTWSDDYQSDSHQACLDWCQDKGWAYIHPNFRGPNRNPEATGSDLAVQDIVDAVTYASRHAAIDSSRVYLIGTSGGGYSALLMAGRHPELWAGVSAWVPITDLTAWYHENKAMGDKHWREVADSCSGPPGTSKEVDKQYKLRSPLTYLEDAREVAIDINAGIRDGHEGSVPVSHSLRAFNTIAHQHDRFTNQDIQSIVETATIPKHLQHEISDPTYGDKQPLLRRYAGRARVTLFDGRHEYIPEAALRWLEKQQLVIPPPSASKLSGLPAKGPYFPVDERIIEDRWELSRKVVPLQRHPSNPLFKGEHPWEGSGPAPQTVFRDPDDGLLKMWYGVWNKYNYENGLPFSYNICYAESSDGLKWNKPVLNLFDHHGSKENNCIVLGKYKTQGIDVEFTPPNSDFDSKLIALHNDKGGLKLTTSEDGKSFQYPASSVVLPYHSDTHNNLVYDEVRDRWLMFIRPQAFAGARLRFDPPHNGERKVGRRRVAMKESKDLKNWSSPRTVIVPGENDPEYFYGMNVFRRGDLFFGLLQRYTNKDYKLTYELAWSGDGLNWQRLPIHSDATILDVGPEGSFDDGMIGMVDQPVEMGDQLWLYYGGWDGTHEKKSRLCSVGVATTQRDRLVAVEAKPGDYGRLLTRPIEVRGSLWINAEAKGSIRVSVHDVNDRPLPGWSEEDCSPFSGDQLEAELKWGDRTLEDLHGQIVRLRFHLDEAKLFSFDLRE